MDPADLAKNRHAWDIRARLHLHSPFYDVPGVKAGRCTLKPPELALLPDLEGLVVAHLQCHFGLDSISLARRGASVVGLDLSPVAIEQARALAEELSVDCRFVGGNVLDAPRLVDAACDVVFVSYGAIGWLDCLDAWAGAVAGCLKPGGTLVMAEFHPVIWMFDDDFERLAYPWSSGPIRETVTGTYASPDAPDVQEMVSWNHGTADVLGALLRAGFTLTAYTEHMEAGFPFAKKAEPVGEGLYRIPSLGDGVPHVYALRASLSA